jgi:hypothetical protein
MGRRSTTLALIPALLAVIMLSLLWVLGADANPGALGFRLDDAWILAVYGRGLLEDGFFSYAPGVPSTGCTSPLWGTVFALAHALLGETTDGIVLAVMLLSASLHVGLAVFSGLLVRKLTGDPLAGAVGGGLVAIATPFAAASFSGMEVVATGLLLLGGVAAATGGRWFISGLLLTLASLSRPESASVALVVGTLAAVDATSPSNAARRLARFALPLALGAGLFLGYDLWASGAPLPATFYAKRSAVLPDLPRRIGIAFEHMLPAVPPLGLGLGWFALLGFVPGSSRAGPDRPGPRRRTLFLPLLAGLVYLTANLYLINPRDPGAFYHQRYLLPAVPLMLVGLALGASRLGRFLSGHLAHAPLALLALLSLVQAGLTVRPESEHLHNDVRNINEVQRTLGMWLRERIAPGTWIAASDAGAIRYFSRLPTIDVLGLNTPEMLRHDETFIREHPVAAITVMPAWLRPREPEATRVLHSVRTGNYTVTRDANMAVQRVVIANPDLQRPAGATPTIRLGFEGVRSFELEFLRQPPVHSDRPADDL